MKSFGADLSRLPKTRAEARRLGASRYVGRPCLHGHIGLRWTANAGCTECRAVLVAAWAASNRERRAASMRAWRKQDPERYKGSAKRWRKNGLQVKLALNQGRRASKRGAEGSYTADDVKRLLEQQKHRCVGPGCTFRFHGNHTVDHKVPLSRGGSNWPVNLQLLCTPCNSSKGTRTDVEWRFALQHVAPRAFVRGTGSSNRPSVT